MRRHLCRTRSKLPIFRDYAGLSAVRGDIAGLEPLVSATAFACYDTGPFGQPVRTARGAGRLGLDRRPQRCWHAQLRAQSSLAYYGILGEVARPESISSRRAARWVSW